MKRIDEINEIIEKVEDLIESISKYHTTKDLIPTFSIIEAIYKNFSDNEKEKFETYHKQLKELCDHILKKEYSLITKNLILDIGEYLIEEIAKKPNSNGKYLAWKLNNYLYLSKEDREKQYCELDEEDDLYRLQDISQCLDFKNNSMDKEEIRDGLEVFLDDINIAKRARKKSLLNGDESVRAAVNNHITTYFEYCNIHNLRQLKEKTALEFMEIVMQQINDASLNIPSAFKKNYKKPQPVFTNRDGSWFYSMMSSGKFDLCASYEKKIITSSTTTSDENDFGDSRLLIDPIKSKLLTNYADKIILSETQFKNMNVQVLLLKMILETDQFSHQKNNNEKNARLEEYRKEIIRVASQQKKNTMIDYFTLNTVKDNQLTEKELIDILGNHVFDFQSLTLDSLSTQENELLIEVWLKKEFSLYAGYTTENTDVEEIFFRNLKLKNPLIKIDPEVMYDNNKSNLLAEMMIEALIRIDIQNMYDKNKPDYISPEDSLFPVFQKIQKANPDKYDSISFISKYFIKQIYTKKNQERFLSLIVNYIHDNSKDKREEILSLINDEKFIRNLDNLFNDATEGERNIKNRLYNKKLITSNNQDQNKLLELKNQLTTIIFTAFSNNKIDINTVKELSEPLFYIPTLEELKKYMTEHNEIFEN